MLISAVDINKDGADDLVLVVGDDFQGSGNQIYVRLQSDKLGLQANRGLEVPNPEIGEKVSDAAVCDLDGDGEKEIVVGMTRNGGRIAAFKVNSDGSPYLFKDFPGFPSEKLKCIDINADGIAEIITTSNNKHNSQKFLTRGFEIFRFNQTTTTLVAAASVIPEELSADVSWGRQTFELADVNSDGMPDLIFVGFQLSESSTILHKRMYVYFNSGGKFNAEPIEVLTPEDLSLKQNMYSYMHSFDVGVVLTKPVIAHTVVRNRIDPPGPLITLIPELTSPSSATSFSTYDLPSSLRFRDVNLDGRDDIIVAHNGWNRIGVHYQNSFGQFSPQQPLSILVGSSNLADGIPAEKAISIGDLDSNGLPDLAVVSQSYVLVFFQQK